MLMLLELEMGFYPAQTLIDGRERVEECREVVRWRTARLRLESRLAATLLRREVGDPLLRLICLPV